MVGLNFDLPLCAPNVDPPFRPKTHGGNRVAAFVVDCEYFFHRSVSHLQPNPSAAAVLRDELDPGSFQGGADGLDRRGPQFFTALKSRDRVR